MATKHRSTKGGTVTRRIKELQGAVQNRIPANEMKGKIQKLKDAMEELGVAQDAVIDSITDDDDKEKNIEEAERWYYAYDDRVNQVVRLAFTSMAEQEENKKAGSSVKIQKLQVPKFDSSPTSYYKWKLTFERYMKQFDDETKYDYLFSLTDGAAHEYVMNRSNYKEAIALLDEKFGNKHLILKLMIDEIRSIPIVKRGDCNAFEKFSFKVTNFRDRLLEMEFYDEVENSYILQEMESKLGVDDLQKWFTSLTDVDHRKVSEFVNWLGNQSHIRKLTQIATLGSSEAGYKTGSFEHTGTFSERYRKGGGYTKLLSNPVAENSETVNCIICNGNHIEISVCPLFPLISFNEKWNVVKSMGVCFICLKTGHQRTDCAESKCDLCWRPHHRLLHNPRRMPGDTDQSLDPNAPPYNSNNVRLTGEHEAKVTCGAIKRNEPPPRSFLPIVNMHLRNGSLTHSCKALIDSGSEINILSLKSSNRLKLKGEPVMISIVGAGGVVTRKFTKKVELMVVEDSGLETQIECIVLDEACGKVSPMGKEIFEKFKDYDISRNTIADGETEVDVLIGMSSPQFLQETQ